ncbi:MAG: YHYH protein [Cyclobacteriaceae bacterium]
MKNVFLIAVIATGAIFYACSKSSVTPTTSVPDVYKKIYGATDMYVDGDFIVIKTKDLPDHKSPYYSGSMYEAYNGSNSFSKNPNSISQQSITFRIPLNPTKASTSAATPLGSIGISLNGVPFYNQYAGPSQPLTTEIISFDQYNGHPQMTGQYHYHVEPLYLTTNHGKDALLGFLLDGFPVYGPLEGGVTFTDSNLDALHGHTSVTADYPNGIYHYHITADAPYINGDGFYGTAGTVTN